jgi:hypothetical protein
MIASDTSASMALSTALVKGWSFSSDNTIDLEIWSDDDYLNTLTIDMATGRVTFSAK